MSEIRINLDREESYAFLAATEFVRQLFSDEEGGIPLISSIRFPLTSRRYARADVVFKLGDSKDKSPCNPRCNRMASGFLENFL